MNGCEACWTEAFTKSQTLGGSQVDWYQRLLATNTKHDLISQIGVVSDAEGLRAIPGTVEKL